MDKPEVGLQVIVRQSEYQMDNLYKVRIEEISPNGLAFRGLADDDKKPVRPFDEYTYKGDWYFTRNIIDVFPKE